MILKRAARPVMPEPVEGRMVPTLNTFGYMTVQLDPFTELYVAESARATPVLEIGAAYGNAALECLKIGARVVANDLDSRHLEILAERAEGLGLAHNLTLLHGRVPDGVRLPEESFGAVLACRVLHFFQDHLFEETISMLRNSLVTGGKMYLILDTPYNKYFSGMIPTFLARKETGAKWPGQFLGEELPAHIRGYNLDVCPNSYNLFDAETLERALLDANFRIERLEYIPRHDYLVNGQMDGRECVGAIATKSS